MLARLFLTSMALAFWSSTLFSFDSFEHIYTGVNGVKLKFPGDPQLFQNYPYEKYYTLLARPENKDKIGALEYNPQFLMVRHENKELKLGYGEIIALAGDFFGILDGNISTGINIDNFSREQDVLLANFQRAFNTLLPTEGNVFYQNDNLAYLRKLFQDEYKSVVLNLGKKGGVHFNNVSSHSVASKVMDQAKYANSPGYSALLSINLDHFGNDAMVAYTAGHILALKKAREAFNLAKNGDHEAALQTLNMAYAMDAFASHFLTDLFSAGHIRTPRRDLFDLSKSTKNYALGFTVSNVGLAANAQHDEDGFSGLWIQNAFNSTWKAFGDGSYFDKKSEDNREDIRDALQASVDEVYLAYQTGEETPHKQFKAMKLIGKPLAPKADVIMELGNIFPLFKSEKPWPLVRANYYDTAVNDYVQLTSFTGISSFFKNDLGTYNHGNFFSLLLEEHLINQLKMQVSIECYNTFDRESIWPSKSRDYTVLGETQEAIEINNKRIQLYKNILLGDLRPDGTYYVVDLAKGENIVSLCKQAMETNYTLEEANAPTVVEIRGRLPRGYSHPIATYDQNGNLNRLLGHKQGKLEMSE